MVVSSLDNLHKVLKERKENEIYIWGSGAYGNLLGAFFNVHDIKWNGYYDNYFEDENGLNDKPIYRGENINKDAVIVLSMKNSQDVYEQLSMYGMREDNVLRLSEICYPELEKINGFDIDKKLHLKELKDIHFAERCFIVGNGPSLKKEDLEMIYRNNEISFGCNEIYKAFDKISWRPKYYVYSDVNGLRDRLQQGDFRNLIENTQISFLIRCLPQTVEYFSRMENVYLFNQIYRGSRGETFSKDCSEFVCIGNTVTYVMLQFALYMGFKEIYLIGMDHNFAREITDNGVVESNVRDHSELIKGENAAYYEIDKVTRAYIEAKAFADKHGIKIYNATRGGKLEVFERVDFDSLF